MNITKESLKKANEKHNLYYEEFESCKKSWKWGAIIGMVPAFLISFLISEFQINEMFFFMMLVGAIGCIPMAAACCALRFTDDFGFSCVPLTIIEIGGSIAGMFAGTVVLVGVALAVLAIGFTLVAIAIVLFTFIFPLETLYYWIRYKIEEDDVKQMMINGQIAAC